MSNWDELSLRDKAEFIKVGVRNGLTSISDIREQYNKFDEGGYTTPEEEALKKIKATTKPASNYSEAIDNAEKRLSQEWPSSLSLPQYEIYPDTTFTRDKTGIGDIEYINQPVITYPNGYQLVNPTGKPTIVVNPNTNTYEDVKLDLLHHYRTHPIYTDLLDQYSKVQLDYANENDDSWVKGDALHGMKSGISKKDAWNNAIDGSLRALLYADNDSLRKTHRYPTLKESQNYLPTEQTKEAFDNINRFLHSYVLPEVIVTPKGNYVYNSYDNVVNKFGSGGFWDTIVNWFSDNKSNNNSNTTQNKADKFTRVLPNDSPTKERSERLENIVAQTQKALYDRAVNKGHDSDPYYIPYVGEELRIPNVGRVSSNTLDSIAVNAERAGIPLSDALGLASVETKFGASPNMSLKAFTDAYPNATEDQKKAYERAVLNSSYMRNYGGIHPQFLVNDHEWANRGWEESAKYKKQLQGITSPLEHAFTLYKLGLYNTGSKKHTSEVKKEGARLMSTPIIQKWNKQRKNKNNVKN